MAKFQRNGTRIRLPPRVRRFTTRNTGALRANSVRTQEPLGVALRNGEHYDVVVAGVMQEPQLEMFCGRNESVLIETVEVGEQKARGNYDNDFYCGYKHLAVPC